MTKMVVLTAAVALALGAAAAGYAGESQEPAAKAPAASDLADAMAQRLGETLRAKTVVGKPVTAGSVTVIPILMIDVAFGGAELLLPGGPPAAAPKPPAPTAGADGFLMSGEARPLGFVVVTRQGTRFISVAQTSAR